MTGAGPQRYPGADQSHRYQGVYGGDLMDVNVVVLHTTEGRTLPDYGGGASAPNLTAVPDLAAQKLRWFQHFDIDISSRALVNKPGGVATNTLNVCQVELVGTCDPKTHAQWGTSPHIYWPDAPEWALAELAVFLRWMNAQHGVPLSGPKAWPAYPSSYGATGARFTFAEWNAFAGVCGHMHVPENDHGDPGALDFTHILALAKGATEEDDMPLSADEIDRIAKAAAKEVRWLSVDDPFKTGDDQTTLGGLWWETATRVAKLPTQSAAPVLSDAQLTALADRIAASPALAEAVATRVDAKLAARLAQ